ncbi:MAG TPA: outer membrane beta-barrel protein [Bryobacteraceae bacterium]|jgi:hypothetical protein
MIRTFCGFLFLSSLAAAQPFGAGLKLGTTLTDTISSLPSIHIVNSNHFIVGPYAEVRLPFGLSVEGDALYEKGLFDNVSDGGSTWLFPIVAKLKFLKGPVRPYIEGGPTFSHIADIAEIPELNHRSNFGIVLGAGVEVKVLVLRISPEVRYYGFALTNIEGLDFHSNRNQATFTLGVGF